MCKFLWNFTRAFKQARGVISIKQCKNSTKIDWKLRNKAKQAQAQSIMQKWVGLRVSPGSMGYGSNEMKLEEAFKLLLMVKKNIAVVPSQKREKLFSQLITAPPMGFFSGEP
jgi:hypothetical protein